MSNDCTRISLANYQLIFQYPNPPANRATRPPSTGTRSFFSSKKRPSSIDPPNIKIGSKLSLFPRFVRPQFHDLSIYRRLYNISQTTFFNFSPLWSRLYFSPSHLGNLLERTPKNREKKKGKILPIVKPGWIAELTSPSTLSEGEFYRRALDRSIASAVVRSCPRYFRRYSVGRWCSYILARRLFTRMTPRSTRHNSPSYSYVCRATCVYNEERFRRDKSPLDARDKTKNRCSHPSVKWPNSFRLIFEVAAVDPFFSYLATVIGTWSIRGGDKGGKGGWKVPFEEDLCSLRDSRSG